MKKVRNHFLILFGLLLLGIFSLAIGTSAEAFPWLNLNSSKSTSPSSISKAKNTGQSANQLSIGDSRNIYISPIGASLGISHSGNSEDTDISSDVGNEIENGGNKGKSIISSIQPNSTGALRVTNSSGDTGHSSNNSNTSSKSPANTNSGSSSFPSSGTSNTSSSGSTSSTSSGSGSNATSSGSTSNTSSSSGSTSHHSHHSHHTVAITSVSINKPTLYFPMVGGTETLKAAILPDNTTQSKNITWYSADESIATVDKNGKVTAVKGGRTKITAKTVNGKTAVCSVTVRIPATKVTLDLNNEPEIEIEKGSSLSLSASLEPIDTTDPIKWITSDSNIISVNSAGKITAINAGTATIKATAGDVSAEYKVTAGISITKIKLGDTDLTLKKGDNKTITATIVPPDTTEDKAVTWKSSDTNIATVDENGKVTAIGGGSAVITAQAGKHIAQCDVTVTVSLTDIKFDPNTVKVAKGKTETLSPAFTPSDATDKALTWGSSDPSIATVDRTTGKVTGVSVGTTTITAISHDGGFVAQCNITVVVPVKSVSLDKTSVNILKGKTDIITATITPKDATDKKIMWSSSNEKVATVDSSGNITAVEGGSAEITVTTHDGGHKAKCDVTVTVPATGISLNKSSLAIVRGTNETLAASILPGDATDKGVSWSSDNTSVATVDSSGKVTGVSIGTAVITATSHDGGFTAKCTVTVIVPVTGVSLNKTFLPLIKGKADTLTATITPADATDKNVTWTSNNTNVAIVDNAGKITATGGGSAVITVTTHDGGYTAKCDVTVTVPVTGIKLDKTRISLMPNATTKLTATITPDDATDKAVTWTSSNPNLVTVDQKGNVKILGKTGSSTVTVTTHDGGYKASCTVLAMIHVKGITLDKTSITVYKGHSASLNAIFTPSDATDKSVTWSSSDTSVATVSSSGNVYGRGYGTATITAISHDGGYKARCTVTVHGDIQAQVLSSYHSSVNEDGSFDLYDDAGTSKHTSNSRHISNRLILTFNHDISYSKGSSIVLLKKINGWIQRYDEAPCIKIYADDKLVATSEAITGKYYREDKDYQINMSNVNCIATDSGTFRKLAVEVTGRFRYGNKDPTRSPEAGGFHLEFPAGGLRVCGRTINSVEVIK